ncbi:hypothetical protein E0Z10_g9733 [Xylaria hypoxylon]|uniref:PNPLA domain-containing protein n=1 Tax=Xylaria hypoxylon TaxID=37992 RepID=A0A4Z0YJI7_9PEZI|nr:hypothetical protein E0Z10_g9733 [Xylaria hypoxylon]
MAENRKVAPPIPKLPAAPTTIDPMTPDSSESKSVARHDYDPTSSDLPQSLEERNEGSLSTQSSLILCFDGGGVKSLASLLVLRELMVHINNAATEGQIQSSSRPPLKPCEVFDFIYGSSSGGLIAIMLGRLEMTVGECIERFSIYTNIIFSHPRLRSQLFGKILPPKYHKRRLVRATKEIISDFDPTTENDKWRRKTFSIPNGRCKTGVTATEMSLSKPYMFRTFDCEESPSDHKSIRVRLPLNPGPASPFTIEEVARATSAAPLLFSTVNIEDREFADAGLTVNNPSQQAMRDVAFLQQDDLTGVCLVSIGSGIMPNHKSSKESKDTLRSIRQLVRTLLDSATQTEETHKSVHELCSDNEIPYFRFNPPLHKEIGIDDQIGQDTFAKFIAPYLEQARNELHMDKRAWVVPFDRNKHFVGRKDILDQLHYLIPPKADQEDCQWTILEGLGGIGNPQIAVEAASRVYENEPDCSVFWVPVTNATSFENAYYEIRRKLNIDCIDDNNRDIKMLVKTALSDEEAGEWLMILDDLDDAQLFFTRSGGPQLSEYIPHSLNGSILCTTHNHKISVDLGVLKSNTIRVTEMRRDEAVQLLQNNLEVQDPNLPAMEILVEALARLPLVIRQASTFMAINGISVNQYLHLFQSTEAGIDLLREGFADRRRYSSNGNTIVSTCMISLEAISHANPRAADLIKYLCIFDSKDIPADLLKPRNDDDVLGTLTAIGTLKSYSFLAEGEEQDSYSIHSLVRLVIKDALKREGNLDVYVTTATRQLASQFPIPENTN